MRSDRALTGTGPVVLVIDNELGCCLGPGSAARHWPKKSFSDEHRQNFAPLAIANGYLPRRRAVQCSKRPQMRARPSRSLETSPYAPDRKGTLATLKDQLAALEIASPSDSRLADGIDHRDDAASFAGRPRGVGGDGGFSIVEDNGGHEPLGLTAGVGPDGKLVATVVRTAALPAKAASSVLRPRPAPTAPFSLAAGSAATTCSDCRSNCAIGDAPRNRIRALGRRRKPARQPLAARRRRYRRKPGTDRNPCSAPLYYLEKAVSYARHPAKDHNLAKGIDAVLKDSASVVLADIGTRCRRRGQDRVRAWVERGGVASAAGAQSGGDDLAPVAPRQAAARLAARC